MKQILNVASLEEALSEPTQGVLDTLRAIRGDVMILGAGGKMGPTVAHMVRRGFDAIGEPQRQVIAVSRFSSSAAVAMLHRNGVQTIVCDLMDRDAVQALPGAPNVIFMAGQKFGTQDAPDLTWVMNTVVPGIVAERFRHSRIVVFSTGCVYPLAPVDGSGSKEEDDLGPPGEYANSCVGRERVFAYFARQHRTPMLFFRLCYAIEMRYGVLLDVAQKVARGLPVDVTMGVVNVIWQGDACARAIQSLAHTASPPAVLNVTGNERVQIRELAQRFGKLMGREPIIVGAEGTVAWWWNASRSYQWFGPPSVSLEEMIVAVAEWVRHGGETAGRATHFEVRDGQF